MQIRARFPSFSEDSCQFCDEEEFGRIIELYGSLKKLQTQGRGKGVIYEVTRFAKEVKSSQKGGKEK